MESSFRMGVKGPGIRFQDRDRGRASSSGFEVGVGFRTGIGIQGLEVSVGFWGWGQVQERGRGQLRGSGQVRGSDFGTKAEVRGWCRVLGLGSVLGPRVGSTSNFRTGVGVEFCDVDGFRVGFWDWGSRLGFGV
ncbi:hypothetical protein TIFTF001_012597 [Ficus carica]|uniref:Uncharacterized protein n=1 Tax=Ficus carica TaxID=3494 RepID=A0AA88D3U8_FICCA|nr:hypothetical protein TIFTF001_012597 [Ficus carica]